MANERTIAILNDLLAAEHGNLIQRLGECNPFVAWPSAEDRVVVQAMLADAQAHQRDLFNLILQLRGAPLPATCPAERGGMHYLNLSHLMPQAIAGVRALIQAYESAAGSGHPDADALISRIATDHRRHLVELERLHSNLASAAAR